MCSTQKQQKKKGTFAIIKDCTLFFTKYYFTKTIEMMRDIEKAFESLKEEFNRKISSDTFMSYFAKPNDTCDDTSSSDSYEVITMDIQKSPDMQSFEDHSFFVTSQEPHAVLIITQDDESISNKSLFLDTVVNTENVSNSNDYGLVKIDYDPHDSNYIAHITTNDEIREVADNYYKVEHNTCISGYSKEDSVNKLDESIADNEDIHNVESKISPMTHIIRINSAERPLKVINEEECVEETPELLKTDSLVRTRDVYLETVNSQSDQSNNNKCILQFLDQGIDEVVFQDKNNDCSDIYIEILTEKEVGDTAPETITTDESNHEIESIDDTLGNDEENVEECGDTTNRSSDSKSSSDAYDSVDFARHYKKLEEDEFLPPIITSQREVPRVPNLVKKQSLQRMMWSEMQEVLESEYLATLPKKQIQLQEAMFEIITSEASYYQSLMILTTHFFESALFKDTDDKEGLLSKTDRHHIFSNIILITKTSLKFCNDLDRRWLEQKPILTDICDIILKHAQSDDFQNYVTYLRNQEYQSKALKRLSENETFRQQLNKLEMSSISGKLSMDSYLMLPMQRLTRLKLLVDTLIKVMECEELKDFIQQDQINVAVMASEKLKTLLDTSDSEKGIMDQKSILLRLMNNMDFPTSFKRISFTNKTFIKEEEVRVHPQNPMRYIKKFSKKRQPKINLILFNDILIVSKNKNSRLLVIDYCERINIEVDVTKYRSIVSSADVSNSGSVDCEDKAEGNEESSLNSLTRSKSSIPSDESKRFSSTFSGSFRSLSVISRSEEPEIINNSFTIKFLKSQTDLFSVPIIVLAKDKMNREEWMKLLKNPSETDGRLHKTTSLKHNIVTKEDFGINKHQSCYTKRKDD